MADITMCKDRDCPLRMKCHRYNAIPGERQSYFVESPRKGDKCDYRIPSIGTEGLSVSEQKWIPVLTSTLANAFDVMVPRKGPLWNGDRDATEDIPPALLDSIIEWFREADFVDDHSVGICACGANAALDELLDAKEGKKYCIKCGGEGFIDGPNEDEYGEPLPIGCALCNSTGKLPIEFPTKGIEPGTTP
jgi:hypothetical protein